MKPGEDDCWLETEHEWIRVHNQPRMHAYVPEHDTALLMDFRRTECFSTEPVGAVTPYGEVKEVATGAVTPCASFLRSAPEAVWEDDWRVEQSVQLGDTPWIGLTRFSKASSVHLGCELVPHAGTKSSRIGERWQATQCCQNS